MAGRDQLSEELIQACKIGHSGTVGKLLSRGANPSSRSVWLETPLHWASGKGHLDVVKLLISDRRCDVNSRDNSGGTPLHYACWKGHLDVVKLLISDRRCDVNSRDNSGGTPLHYACWKGHLDVVKLLISDGRCDVNSRDNVGGTPLHYACREGHLDVVKLLISDGRCDVYSSDWIGGTPLHEACRKGHLDVVKLLISDGRCYVNSGDWVGNTPLHEACRNGHLNIVKCLITEGHCDVNSKNGSGDTPLHEACRYWHLNIVKCLITEGHCDVNIKDSSGHTPLHEACRNGRLNIVKCLIMEGHCDVNIKDRSGDTPLHEACREGHLDIVKWLITEGHCDVNIENMSGDTPLHWAYREGQLDIVKWLISEGHCDVNIKGNSGYTPLHEACRKGQLNIVKWLISEGHCDVNIKGNSGYTPLHEACRKGQLNIVKWLISEGHCDVNIKGNSGYTPLHEACRRQDLNIMKCLITEGHCDVNSENGSGDTPLHEACKRQDLNIMKCLITEGHCDVNVKNRSGHTPLHEACREGQLDIVKWLISEGHCDVNIKGNSGYTPLHEACRKGPLNIVKWLISEGHCDVNIKGNSGYTPFHEACRRQDLNIMKCLITEGHCDVNSENGSGDTPLHEACRRQDLNIMKCLITEGHCDVNVKNRSGDTPLHEACREGQLDIVKWLISEGHCDVNIKGNSGYTPLHEACRKGQLNIVKWLISEGHCDVNIKGNSGCTPLHEACRNGHLNVMKCLIMEGHCDVNSENESGNTPLHEACRNRDLNVMKCLIMEGHCYVNSENKSGDTPLHEACWSRDVNVMKCLIMEGHCDVNSENESGDTPLHEACWNGDLNVMKCLIMEGHCDVNSENESGNTPLHEACWMGLLNFVKCLITEGHCDVNIKDRSGDTPLHVACRYGHAQIVHYFLSERIYTVKKDDKTLLNLTDDPSTIRELLRHGANPDNVYAQYCSHLPEHSPRQPPEPAVKIFTVGDHGTGKSTLVKALEKEGSGFSRVAGRLRKVTGVDEKTAGIIPHKVESRFFGHVALYDFAGHKEFYASHAAMIRQSMTGSSTAIFLVLADLRSSDGEFKGSILSWLSFIDNECPLGPKPHIIIVGSHADEMKSKDQIAKSNVVDSLKDTEAFSNVQFKGYIAINCCYSQSTSITELRQLLAESSEAIRIKSKPSFNTHCFSIYLLDKFRDLEAVKFSEVLIKVSENSTLAVTEIDDAKLLSFIPTDAPRLCEMCEDLHDRGSILLLRNTEKPEESWIVLDQTALLTKVTGKVFAPEGFKEHEELASTTGVLPFRKFRDHFPSLDPDMVAQYLCHLEFCQEVTDDEVLKLLQIPVSISCKESVFFFPSLVNIDAPGLEQGPIPAHASPTQIWKPNSDYVYKSGWILQCSKAEHHFTPRFLQVFLLRLAFFYALAPHIQEIKSDVLEIKREVYVWKRGICWVTQSGVGALVEMDQSGKTVTVLLRCLERSKIKCIHLRSAIIHKALCAREKFCPKVSTSEYFIHPDAIEYPLKPIPELNLFSISQITRAIAAGHPCVIGKDSQPLDLEKLLYFEPYFHLSKTIVQELFDEEKASCDVDDKLMDRMAKCFRNKWDDVFSMLKLPDSTVMEEAPPSSIQAIVRLLQLWHLRSRKGSYQCLHRELDQFSVFAGRNPLSPTSFSLFAQSTAETASEVDSTTDKYSTIIDSVDETTLGIESLLEVRTALREATLAWLNLGLALGLFQHTLESIQCHDTGHCLTETLAAWLQGRGSTAAPTWRAIVKALLSPAINFYRLALLISNAHQCNDSGYSSMTGSEDHALQNVDNTKLEHSSLIHVKSALLAGGRHLTWFELGLALGLYYGTLKFIQSEHSNDDKCLTETLAAWLKQKDRVPEQGVPSWNSLTRALAHPLVIQQGLAWEIAMKHPKIVPVVLPSASPAHTLTSSPPPSDHTVTASTIGNQ